MATKDEVYRAYGAACHTAQQFEGLLIMCLTLLESQPGSAAERFLTEAKSVEELIERVADFVESKPLGVLLKMISKHGVFDKEEETTLRLALETRNRLVHGFFSRNESRLELKKGREKVVEELLHDASLFINASEFVLEELPDRAFRVTANRLIEHGIPINVLSNLDLKR